VESTHYVILLTYFNNPLGDAAAVMFLGLIAFILAFPLRSAMLDRRFAMARTTVIVLIAITLFASVSRTRSDRSATSRRSSRHRRAVKRAVAYVVGLRDTQMRCSSGPA